MLGGKEVRRTRSVREVGTAELHRRRIAVDTLRMTCVAARIMSGMDHIAAAELLGRRAPEGCDCARVREAYAAALRE